MMGGPYSIQQRKQGYSLFTVKTATFYVSLPPLPPFEDRSEFEFKMKKNYFRFATALPPVMP
jgi:hypothetical protein